MTEYKSPKPTHADRLLAVFCVGGYLTDLDAAQLAGVDDTGYWKRTAELRRDGLIREVGMTKGASNKQVKVSRITREGVRVLSDIALDA